MPRLKDPVPVEGECIVKNRPRVAVLVRCHLAKGDPVDPHPEDGAPHLRDEIFVVGEFLEGTCCEWFLALETRDF